MKEHLLLDLSLEAEYRIQVLPYKSILNELKALCTSLSPKEKVWVSDKASYAVSEAIPKVGSPTEAQINSATLPGPAPSHFWRRIAVSLKQRLVRQSPQDWLSGQSHPESLRALRAHRVLCLPKCGMKDGLSWHTLILWFI